MTTADGDDYASLTLSDYFIDRKYGFIPVLICAFTSSSFVMYTLWAQLFEIAIILTNPVPCVPYTAVLIGGIFREVVTYEAAVGCACLFLDAVPPVNEPHARPRQTHQQD
uniref:EamA domain-containing protein n=1 Tax=Panagrellus redivivus TaxID=6233 RepID=A0A7E4UNT9_PANRE